MIKRAGIEDSSLTDPKTGLKISVSTTTRLKYRDYIEKTIGSDEKFSNIVLNDIIANDFYNSSNNVLHYFIANSSNISTRKREWIEIRKLANARGDISLWFSILRPTSIDIITVSGSWKQPKKARSKAG